MTAYATVPTVDEISQQLVRIYFGTRDKLNRSHISFIESEKNIPSKLSYIHDRPVLSPGKLGTFDDSGCMPSWIVNYNNNKYLYYIGWNVRNTIPYHNSIGLAISIDGGDTFQRYSDGPLLERTHLEPYFCAAPCVIIDSGIWRMWYLSCVKWVNHVGKAEPYYHIKYAESKDGIVWDRKGIVCIDFQDESECGITRPSVLKDGDIYKMWYCYRGLHDYRKATKNSYRIGYAESNDGISWIRRDHSVGIDVSTEGWDSEMIEYPCVYKNGNKKIMLYNGNTFGKTGFGYAETMR
ncbi:hypothetical protein [Brevibacillus sp. 179-C 1.1 NHS]|uniref:hypothetical protein n=1 Tax=Brevibacillus sp. 179-C 1.1 NHS TaxID=3235177 RepID=UPI0039A1627A